MATVVAMQTSPIRSNPVPIAPAMPQNLQPSSTSKETLIRPKPMNYEATSSTGIIVGGKDRPCDACRKRKSRCAMNEATRKCYSCDFHRQDCTFLENLQPHKKRADSRVNSTDGDKSIDQTRRSSNASSSVSLNGYQQPLTQSKNTSGSSTPSISLAHLQAHQFSQHIGRTTEIEPLLLDHLPLDQNDETQLSATKIRKYGDDGTFMKVLDGDKMVPETQISTINEIESVVAPHGSELVNKFFCFVHPTFPVLVENEFRDLHRSRMRVDPILLCSVYILALNWWGFEGTVSSRKSDAVRLETIVGNLLPGALFRPRISTIQAGLLLSQRPHLNSSSLTSQLVTAGFELGLHQDCTDWRIPSSDKELRRRLAWALYMQDKWCALVHGRPSHIVPANWTVKPLTESDFEGGRFETVSESGNGAIQFTQMVALTGILSDILDTFYTLQAVAEFRDAGNGRTRLILEKAKPVQIKLKDWFSRLPLCLKMDTSIGDQPCSTGSLHLAYFAAEITLHRCIIGSLDTTTADSYLFHICRSAAKTRLISAMDFVNRLRVCHLKSSWYFASRTNFALVGSFGMLLRATALSIEEADFYRNRLEEYRWTLTMSSKDTDFVMFAVESLDATSSLVNSIPEKPTFAEVMAASPFAQQATNASASNDSIMRDVHAQESGYFDQIPRPEPPIMPSSGLASPATSFSSSPSGPGGLSAMNES